MSKTILSYNPDQHHSSGSNNSWKGMSSQPDTCSDADHSMMMMMQSGFSKSTMMFPMAYNMTSLSIPSLNARMSSSQDSREKLFDIIDSAQQVLTATTESDMNVAESRPNQEDHDCWDLSVLEPTPIGPQGIQTIVSSGQDIPSFSQQLLCCHEDDTHRQVMGKKRKSCSSESILTSSRQKAARTRKCAPTKDDTDASGPRFRHYQDEQWNTKYQDLVTFKAQHGHCLVPHSYPPDQQLAQWTKRQRYQYKLKCLGRHCTLTDARQELLQQMGFVWHSHNAAWYEKYQCLKQYYEKHGHSNVPAYYTDKSLAVWVKCQRRQMKLDRRGEKSTMTPERENALQALDFDWNPRNLIVN